MVGMMSSMGLPSFVGIAPLQHWSTAWCYRLAATCQILALVAVTPPEYMDAARLALDMAMSVDIQLQTAPEIQLRCVHHILRTASAIQKHSSLVHSSRPSGSLRPALAAPLLDILQHNNRRQWRHGKVQAWRSPLLLSHRSVSKGLVTNLRKARNVPKRHKRSGTEEEQKTPC